MNRDSALKLKDGRILAYAEYGDPHGKPIFYFHGWPASRLSGLETDSAAKKLRVRIISPDRPGFGLSSYKKERALLDWADDVEELADFLKIKKFAVMGVSGGGPYSAVCAYKIPERITKAAIVVGLAPVNIKGITKGIFFSARIGWENYHRFPFLRTFGAWVGALEFKYLPFIGKHVGFQAKTDRKLLNTHSINLSSCKEAYRQGIKGPELDLKLYTDEWGFKLSDIKTKVYLWYGAKDENVSLAMGKYYKSQIPNSKLFIDPNGGHLSRTEHEEEILRTLLR